MDGNKLLATDWKLQPLLKLGVKNNIRFYYAETKHPALASVMLDRIQSKILWITNNQKEEHDTVTLNRFYEEAQSKIYEIYFFNSKTGNKTHDFLTCPKYSLRKSIFDITMTAYRNIMMNRYTVNEYSILLMPTVDFPIPLLSEYHKAFYSI